MRRLLGIAAILLAAAGAAAATSFVSPLEGAQAIGPMLLEIRTDAANVDRVEFYVDGVLAGVARQAPYRIAYDFGTTLAARSVTAKVWSNGFRSSESAAVTTAALTANDTLHVHLVEVPMRVRASREVKASDLRVRENGVEQKVRDVKRERPPAHFAFIVDRSLSMGDGKLEAALAAIRSELRQLRPGDTSSVVFFNHHVSKPQPVADAAHVAPSGGTSLRDAVASVASNARTYAIVITDGGDRNSALSDEEALRRVSGTKTVVHALVLGSGHAKFLDRAAANTGGSVVAASPASIRDELASLLSDINSRYLVIYQSSVSDRGWRKVDVQARTRGVAVVQARKGYFAE